MTSGTAVTSGAEVTRVTKGMVEIYGPGLLALEELWFDKEDRLAVVDCEVAVFHDAGSTKG